MLAQSGFGGWSYVRKTFARRFVYVFVLQFHPPTLSGSNFPYTKNRAGAGVWIVGTQRSVGRDLILGTPRVLRGPRSDFRYTKSSARGAIGIFSTQRIFEGGDATENGDFPIRKQRLQRYKTFRTISGVQTSANCQPRHLSV